MNPLVYEGPKSAQDVPTEPAPVVAPPTKTFKVGDFEFNQANLDEKTGTISLASLINLLLIALTSSEDLNIRRVLSQSNIEVRDLHDKVYFPRLGE